MKYLLIEDTYLYLSIGFLLKKLNKIRKSMIEIMIKIN